jgi:hypothetical protein
MSKYEVIETETSTSISRTDDNGQVWWIPADPANSDYQRYLRWVENPNAEVEHLTSLPTDPTA